MGSVPGDHGIAVKKNMVPLFGIAVVVAIISTGVFYGLFAGKLRSASVDVPGQPMVVAARDLASGTELASGDLRVSEFKSTLTGTFSSREQLVGATLLASVKHDEPLMEERLVLKNANSSASGRAVPPGLRAVSIRVSDSESLLGLLHPGAKVDVQSIEEHNGGLQLKTILQNVEVLAANPQTQPAGNRGPVAMVTVLTRAEDADLVALADSATRIRLTLRNPLDDQIATRHPVALSSLFQSNPTAAAAARTESPSTADSRNAAHAIDIQIQVLRATAMALNELESNLVQPMTGDTLTVAKFRTGDGGEIVRTIEKQGEAETVLEENLNARAGRPAKLQTGPASCQLRMQFIAKPGADGKLAMRVRPEISSQVSQGFETHVFEAELPATGSFLVTGILGNPTQKELMSRLFPRQSWRDRALAILVTSKEVNSEIAPKLAQSRRGR